MLLLSPSIFYPFQEKFKILQIFITHLVILKLQTSLNKSNSHIFYSTNIDCREVPLEEERLDVDAAENNGETHPRIKTVLINKLI